MVLDTIMNVVEERALIINPHSVFGTCLYVGHP